MNHTEKMAACKAIFDECLEILDAKGRDYSGTEDGMGNFKDFGWKGIIVRLGDKYHRLKNLTKSEASVDESVEDTLYDTINYAALTLVMKSIEETKFADKLLSEQAKTCGQCGHCGTAINDEFNTYYYKDLELCKRCFEDIKLTPEEIEVEFNKVFA